MKRLVIALALIVAASPSVASAQQPADNYLNGPNINNAGEATPEQYDLDEVDTSGFGIENPIPGSTNEVTSCPLRAGVRYGKTAWFYFWASVRGRAFVQAGPFDTVIALVPQNTVSPFDPLWGQGLCYDDPTRESNEFAYLDVVGGRWYAAQIGGYAGEGPSGDPSLALSGPGNLETRFQFVPDPDGDGVFGAADSCPNTFGSLANGCPPLPPPPPRPDSDNDGVFDDGPDKCTGENARARDANSNGCLDLATFSPNWVFDPGPYFVVRGGRNVLLGVRVQGLGVADLPGGASVQVSCKPRRVCKSLPKKAKSNGRVEFGTLRGKKLRAGTQVILRITKSGYVGSWRRYRIGANKFLRPRNPKDRGCLRPGSNKLRRSGSCPAVR